jgi:hypothetical protein
LDSPSFPIRANDRLLQVYDKSPMAVFAHCAALREAA